MTSLTGDTRIRLAAKVRMRRDRITGRPMALYPEGVLFLSDSAEAIVSLCDGRPLAEIVAALAADVVPEQRDAVAADVPEFCAGLITQGILTTDAPEDGGRDLGVAPARPGDRGSIQGGGG